MNMDAPHTGARLETLGGTFMLSATVDAPHTGARLETSADYATIHLLVDAPHTGARLETDRGNDCGESSAGCPPHGGTT